MHFQLYYMIHDVSPKYPHFSENSQCLTTFLAELLRGIERSEVVLCSDRAAAFTVGAASIPVPAGDR
jgi:hypothetical protein